MVLWALVRLGYKPGPRFLRDVESVLLARLPHMAPGDIAITVWSFARLRYKVGALWVLGATSQVWEPLS